MKILIIGNCGSGKTYLSEKLSEKINIPSFHMDGIMWIPYTDFFRENSEIENDMTNIINKKDYILEGCWGNISNYILKNDNIDLLIFLDIYVEECKNNILGRISEEENGKISYEERLKITKTAENYYKQTVDENELSSILHKHINYNLHNEIYRLFNGKKIHLKTKFDINIFISEF